jgi:hypothetical protein
MKKEDVYARMMHTPDDPERAELRASLREIRKHLLPLHRALIDAASTEFSVNVSPVNGPTHLLQLLQDEPFFAWLKPLTALIVEIDSITSTDFEPAAARALVARTEQLFAPATDSEFSIKYVPILQRDVDVAIGHAAIRQVALRLQK